jgi:hypothetical protein
VFLCAKQGRQFGEPSVPLLQMSASTIKSQSEDYADVGYDYHKW